MQFERHRTIRSQFNIFHGWFLADVTASETGCNDNYFVLRHKDDLSHMQDIKILVKDVMSKTNTHIVFILRDTVNNKLEADNNSL